MGDGDRSGFHRTYEVDGHRLTPLTTGAGRLDALVALIEGAEQSLRILYYIFADDATGRRVRDALAAAAARGVAVDLIVDGFGSDKTADAFFAPIAAAGGSFCSFVPRFGRRYLLRNHQKLALADEARAIVGGFNVADDYFGAVAEGAWRDFGLLVEGPAAARIAAYFDALSAWTRDPKGKVRTLRHALDRFSEREGRVRWLLGGPARRLSPWALAIKREATTARRFDMIAAYFAPHAGMMRRLERIGRAPGRRARIITAAISDNNATVAAARHCYRRLLRRGVEVWEYQATKLHTKLYVIDDSVHIGSANFDVRSLYLNLEIMLRIEDAEFAAHMRRYFEQELDGSVRVTREDHRARSTVFNRLRWGFAYFLVAIADYGVSRRLDLGIE